MSEKQDKHAKDYHELSGSEGLKKIAELVKGIRICMLNTQGEDGRISSRPMAAQDVPFYGTLWFLASIRSEKIDEIGGDRHVTLTFAEPSDSKYIALKGRATYSQDKAKIHELWSTWYKAWFPGGEDDPDIAVLRIDVSEADYWEANSSKIVMGMKYMAAAVTGGSVAVGEAGHVTVSR
jgi:general stress protein 26